MQKFEDSFDGTYNSSGKKNAQQVANTKKTKIIINIAGIPSFILRDAISGCQACR